MKKIGIVATIVGAIIIIMSIVLKFMEEKTVSIIGGADEPTSVFVAGQIGNGSGMIGILVGIGIIVVGLIIILRKR